MRAYVTGQELGDSLDTADIFGEERRNGASMRYGHKKLQDRP